MSEEKVQEQERQQVEFQTESEEVKVFFQHLLCPQCKDGTRMEFNGTVINQPGQPPQYQHGCPECGGQTLLPQKFPVRYYETLPEAPSIITPAELDS